MTPHETTACEGGTSIGMDIAVAVGGEITVTTDADPQAVKVPACPRKPTKKTVVGEVDRLTLHHLTHQEVTSQAMMAPIGTGARANTIKAVVVAITIGEAEKETGRSIRGTVTTTATVATMKNKTVEDCHLKPQITTRDITRDEDEGVAVSPQKIVLNAKVDEAKSNESQDGFTCLA